jgi:hypothetical protein
MIPFRGNHLIVHLPRVRSIKPLIRPVFLPCLLALLLRSPSQGRLLTVYTRPSDLWPVYMSLPEDENRPVDAERRDPEHLGRIDVFPFSPRLARAHQLGHVQGISPDDFDDPNFDPTASLLEDESPYPEVRSAAANTDDPKMASSTLHAWVVGLIWAVLIPGVNQFFYFRYPSIGIGPARLQ